MTERIIERLDRMERLLRLQGKEALTAAEVGLLLDMSESRVRHLASERELPYYKSGNNRTYFKRTEIEEWQLRDRVPTDEEVRVEAAGYGLAKRGRAKA